MKVELGWSMHYNADSLQIVPETVFEKEFLESKFGKNGCIADFSVHPSFRNGVKVEVIAKDQDRAEIKHGIER